MGGANTGRPRLYDRPRVGNGKPLRARWIVTRGGGHSAPAMRPGGGPGDTTFEVRAGHSARQKPTTRQEFGQKKTVGLKSGLWSVPSRSPEPCSVAVMEISVIEGFWRQFGGRLGHPAAHHHRSGRPPFENIMLHVCSARNMGRGGEPTAKFRI